jgi:hypothetical protein
MRHSKLKSFTIFLVITILTLLTVGCSELFEYKPSLKVNEIALTPIELFKGDGDKFKPFMGAMSGAFQLRYKGTKPHATLDIDIWRNGKKEKTIGAIGDLFFQTQAEDSKELEVIISIDKVAIEGQAAINTIKVGLRSHSASNIAVFTAPWDNKLNAIGLIQNSEPRILNTNESVHVWGMHATSTNEIRTSDFSPEALSRIEYAIMFTLRFDELDQKS